MFTIPINPGTPMRRKTGFLEERLGTPAPFPSLRSGDAVNLHHNLRYRWSARRLQQRCKRLRHRVRNPNVSPCQYCHSSCPPPLGPSGVAGAHPPSHPFTACGEAPPLRSADLSSHHKTAPLRMEFPGVCAPRLQHSLSNLLSVRQAPQKPILHAMHHERTRVASPLNCPMVPCALARTHSPQLHP